MGREIRMVPPGWEHPKNERGNYIPLLKGPFSKRLTRWDEEAEQWEKGFRRSWSDDTFVPKDPDHTGPFSEWDGERPKVEDYMPEWAPGEATHLRMYEDTSEGTPISRAFATPEELARWLADTGASAFGGMTATYEQWLSTCKRGWAVSMVMGGGKMMSGVEASVRP